MNSSSDKNINSHSLLQAHSLDIKNTPFNQYKSKQKNTNKIRINNRLYEHQRQKGNFKYLEKYIHKYFISFYKNTKNDYNVRMIDDILNNESTHLVAEFKDYLIMGDITEFLQKSYNIQECKKYLPKIYEYYNSCSVIFPNYVTLHESKYIYKNIRKKQKVIDNQQEQEEKQEKIKKGDIKLDDNEQFFSSKTFNSILDQTNTSNVKLFFGINNDIKNIDANETPNNIVEKLEKAEKDAIQRKMNLVKNKKKPTINDNNTTNSINNSNLVNNNSKIYIKNKIIKERNKNNGNLHYLSSQKKSNLPVNNYSNININNININNQNQSQNKIRINSYLSKNKNPIKTENDYSKNHIKSSTSITDNDNDTNKGYNNYITFYGNNFNHSKRKNTRKLFIESSGIKPHQIYIRNGGNHSNKNIKKKYINSLFPSKNIISKIFNNFNNNSVLKQNSFNFINKKMANKNIKEENQNQLLNSPGFPLSPSSITIQANPFRNKYNYNLNINIKESNSTRNVVNHSKLNGNGKSNEKVNLKNIQEKIRRNDKQSSLNYNSNTISTTIGSKTTTNNEKIKYIHTNKNFNYNKPQIKNNYNNNNFKTIVNNSRSNININNTNNNNNIIYCKTKNNNNINFNNNNANYINKIMIKDLNIHKINSTSNIKKPINMNININMSNNSKNRIYFNEGSCGNIINNKIYSKSPLSIELETIKVSTKKRTLYPKSKKLDNKNQKIVFNNNYNGNIINSINNNTISNEKNYYVDSFGYTSLNSNNQNDEINNGIKNDIVLEELNKKKNIILPFNKEINNINININGYNAHGGCLTSRTSNNVSKKKNKSNGNNNGKEIYYYNQDFKMKIKNKNMKKINNNNNLVSKNESNPVKIKKIYDNVKNSKNIENRKITGYFKKKKK